MSERALDDRPGTIYKVLNGDELARLEREGGHDGTRDDLRDGYIHFSTAEQLPGTIEKHCADIADPQIVAVDAEAQGAKLKWEAARGGQLFPHLYGPLLLETVIAYGPLEHRHDGSILLPVAG